MATNFIPAEELLGTQMKGFVAAEELLGLPPTRSWLDSATALFRSKPLVAEGLKPRHRYQDRILRPEYITQVGQELDQLPPEQRFAELQRLAKTDPTVRGRAAKSLLARDIAPDTASGRVLDQKFEKAVPKKRTLGAGTAALGLGPFVGAMLAARIEAAPQEFAAVLDLALGFPAFAAQVGATGVATGAHALAGTPNPIQAGTETIGKAMTAPWMKFLLHPLQTGLGTDIEKTTVGEFMGGLSGVIENAAEYWSEKTGSTETGEALKQATQIAMLKGGDAFVSGFRKWSIKNGKLPPELTPVEPFVRNAPRLSRPTPETIDVQGRFIPAEELLGFTPRPTVPAAAQVPRAPAAAPSSIITSVLVKQKPATTLYVDRLGNVTDVLSKQVTPASGVNWITMKGLAAVGVVGAAAALTDKPEDAALGVLALGSLRLLKDARILDGAGKVLSESRLLEALQKPETNNAAARVIYETNVKAIERSLYKYQNQGIDPATIAHDVLTKFIVETAPAFRGEAKIQSYLIGAAKNAAIDSYRGIVRARTEPLEGETEIAGKGRDDVVVTKGFIDESILGRSPEQSAQNTDLARQMQEGLDKLPEQFRKPFMMRELEGMDYQAIADELGLPPGTIRSQINRAKERLQEHLKEYSLKGVAAVAGASALVAYADLDSEDYLALAGAGAMTKGKGGNWTPATIKRLSNELLSPMGGRVAFRADAPNVLEQGRAATVFVDRIVPGYLQKHAGTATDPLNNLVMPSGRTWESMMDDLIEPRADADTVVQGMNLRPGEEAWNVSGLRHGGAAGAELVSYLRHAGEYAAANIDPAKFGQYDFVRLIQEVAAQDKKVAKAAEIARKIQGTEELKRMETMPTPMTFADGARIVQLKRAGEFAHESTVFVA